MRNGLADFDFADGALRNAGTGSHVQLLFAQHPEPVLGERLALLQPSLDVSAINHFANLILFRDIYSPFRGISITVLEISLKCG
jgi:hypothetical protein